MDMIDTNGSIVILSIVVGMAVVMAASFLYVIESRLRGIEKTLEARGLTSPHVIVTTRDGGVMEGMQLDVSGPGYKEEPILKVEESTADYKKGCRVKYNTFICGSGVALPTMKTVRKVNEDD